MTQIHETKKAIKFEKDGIQFWVQKRWVRSDGSLTPAGEKSFAKAKAEAGKPKGTNYIKVDHLIDRETEKAIMIKINVDFYNIEKDMNWSIWLPKSMIKDGRVPEWLLNKKIDQAESELRDRFSNRGGFMIDTEFDDVVFVAN